MYDLTDTLIPAWYDDARCGHIETDVFYRPMERGNHQERRELEEAAKNYCRTCPVQVECLNAALDSNEPYGIWGGLTPNERKNAKRRTRRAAA